MHSNDSNSLSLNILNYSGPLDALLELAKSQKVDLNQISITELADQFHNFLTKSAKLNLNLASEYLLMATWLIYLKSKLLLPETEEEEFKALEVATKLKLISSIPIFIKKLSFFLSSKEALVETEA